MPCPLSTHLHCACMASNATAAGVFALLLTLVALLLAAPTAANDFSGWSQGRATFYGEDGSINWGSCMFGQLDGSKGTGLDIAALSDKNSDYVGSCGRCYEVACRPASVTDGYGNTLDRTWACYGGSRVTVMVTDTCPCNYPSNYYSNTRWCCGDAYHMDLSKWAFEKIANTGAGAIAIYYRQVPCPGGSYSSSSSSSSSGGSSWSSSSSSYNSGSSNSGWNGNSWESGSSQSSSSSSSSSGGGSSWSSSSRGSDGGSSSSSYSSSGPSSGASVIPSWLSEMLQKSNSYKDSNWPNRGR